MKKESKEPDLDLLLAGLSPEETRRLQKIPAEWARGDENGFPVQLALLTKAQWRVAATLPASIAGERKALVDQWERARMELAASGQSAREEFARQIKILQSEVGLQSAALRDAVATMRHRLAETDQLACEIRGTLSQGQRAWEQAKADFETQRSKLEAEHRWVRETSQRDTGSGSRSSWDWRFSSDLSWDCGSATLAQHHATPIPRHRRPSKADQRPHRLA
jgi:hypothetical protein